MDILPVIDLKSGQVVHARGGRRDEYAPIRTPLSPTSAPGEVVAGLLRLFPFRRLYVADLDAIEGRGGHGAVLDGLMAAHPGLEIWLDSGSGAGERRGMLRPVIGSESLRDAAAIDPHAILSLDFRGDTFLGPPELLENTRLWPRRLIVMTLARVGAEAGPDLARVEGVIQRAEARQVYAAGGVRNAGDLRALARIGAAGALVATALHSGSLGAEELQAIARP